MMSKTHSSLEVQDTTIYKIRVEKKSTLLTASSPAHVTPEFSQHPLVNPILSACHIAVSLITYKTLQNSQLSSHLDYCF